MQNIAHYISTFAVGSPVTHKALSVFPVRSEADNTGGSYLLLDEALATGRFRISEVSESGTVPRLLATNETSSPVFLLDGEELVGAKQNRVLNVSILVAAKSATEIPVSCVEAGRWRAESDSFRAPGRVHFSRGRADTLCQVSESLRMRGRAESNQSAVWEAIAAKSRRMKVDSPTAAMAAMYEGRKDDLDSYLDRFLVGAGQVGAVYAIGRTIAGLDVFDSEHTFSKLSRKLVSSYALDAMEHEAETDCVKKDDVTGFLRLLGLATCQRYRTAGLGENVRLATPGLVGAALTVDDAWIHLAAFPRQGYMAEATGYGPRMQRASMRARRW